MIPRAAVAAVLLTSTLVVAGCTDLCTPVEVPTEVSLSLSDEEARTLPILVSGATRLAGQELPDSHGRLAFNVSVTHPDDTNASLAFRDVEVSGLSLALSVGGRDVPVKILQVEGGSAWRRVNDNHWDGGAVNGSRITLWWAVDKDRLASITELALDEGAAYELRVDFDWRHESCNARASGHTTATFDDFVEASVIATHLAPAGEATFEREGPRAGFEAPMRVTSGHDVRIVGTSARAIILSRAAADASTTITATTGAPGVGGDVTARVVPGLALALFPTLSSKVGGGEAAQVTPRDTLVIHSADANGAYATSGTVTGLTDEPELVIILVEVEVAPQDPTLGATRDLLAYVAR